MPEPLSLPELMVRARTGDEQARSELYARFTPCLHRHIRLRLLYSSLKRHCDSTEIVNSVWGRFFVRLGAASWRPEWDKDANALQGLLLRMADDNLAEKGRRRANQHPLLADDTDQPDDSPAADTIAEAKELVCKARTHCTDLEWTLLELLADGVSYVEIARRHDMTADAVRMRVNRLLPSLRTLLGS